MSLGREVELGIEVIRDYVGLFKRVERHGGEAGAACGAHVGRNRVIQCNVVRPATPAVRVVTYKALHCLRDLCG
jgi:hypothetical protein